LFNHWQPTSALTYTLYEVKHSKEVVAEQCRHLLDEESCRSFEEKIAPISGKRTTAFLSPIRLIYRVGFG